MEMEGQQRLWRPAVEAGVIQLRWEGYSGWTVLGTFRRQGEGWGEHLPHFYSGLVTDELVDVLEAMVRAQLGL